MRKKGSLVPIGSFLEGFFEKRGWSSTLQEYRIWTQWEKLAGVELGKRCRPSRLHNQVLTLTVTNSSWMTQLQFMKSKLIEKIKRSLHVHLKDIYFKIGSIDIIQKKNTQEPLQLTDNSYMASRAWQHSQTFIHDNELKYILENIFKKYYQDQGGK